MSFYLKYRPARIDQLDLEGVRQTLGRVLTSGQVAHAYLFVGPRGAGKTSAARILARVINCEANREAISAGKPLVEPCGKCESCTSIERGSAIDVLEIDAASNRGIDAIRELKEKIGLAPVSAYRKVYIIDEVHMLTTEAFNALLKTLEEPPEHVHFILCTTEDHKVPETIASRCVRVAFTKAQSKEVIGALKKAIEGEEIKISTEALERLAESVDGSLREAHNLLEQLAQNEGEIDLPMVMGMLGQAQGVEVEELGRALVEGKTRNALTVIQKGANDGVNWMALSQELLKMVQKELRASFGIGESRWGAGSARLVVVANRLAQVCAEMKTTPIEELPLELAAVELGQEEDSVPNKRVAQDSEGNKEVKDEKELSQKVSVKESKEEIVITKVEQELPSKNETKQTQKLEPVVSEKVDKIATIEEVRNKWSQLLDALRPKNHSVAGLLRSAQPKAVDGRFLVIEVFYKFHKDQLEQEIKRKLLEDTLAEVVAPLVVRCVLGERVVEAMRAMPEHDNVVVTPAEAELASVVEDVFGVEMN